MDRVHRRLLSSSTEDTASGGLLVLETRRGRVLCPEAEILGVFAEGDMSRVLMRGDRQIYCLRGLKHFEQVLRPGRFARLDRSAMLDLEAVRELQVEPGAKIEVSMTDSLQPLSFGRAAGSRLRKALTERATQLRASQS